MSRCRLTPIAVLVACLAAVAPAAAGASHTKQPGRYYVSLGDSLAVGWQPDAKGRGRETNQGYADRVYSRLRKKHRGLRHIRLGCAGENTTSMMKGGICSYRKGRATRPKGRSQLDAATRFIRAHRRHIVAVTIDIGANDVAGCAKEGRVDLECIDKGLKSLNKNLVLIAKDLRRAGGPEVRMAAMTYYNPFWQFWLLSEEGKQTAQSSNAVLKLMNRTLASAFGAKRFRIARVYQAFRTEDTTTVTYQGRPVPRAVERICVLTYMCDPEPVGPDIHTNPKGYELIAKAFRAVL